MINPFKRKAIEKESNVALTPEDEDIRPPQNPIKVAFLVWNLLSITLYSCYTLFITYKLAEKTFLSKIIIYLLAVYAVTFVLLILINLGNNKRLKRNLKNYKSATKFFKYAIQILNFTLSIITAISAFITTGTTDISAIAFAVLSIIVTFFMILFEVAKIIVRKNIPLIKQNFLDLRDKTSRRGPKPNRKTDN